METTLTLPVFIFSNTQFIILLIFISLADAVLFMLIILIFKKVKCKGGDGSKGIVKAEDGTIGDEDRNEEYRRAIDLVQQNGKASTSFLQRHLRVGYNCAVKMLDMMEKDGIVGPAEGVRPRKVLLERRDKATPRDDKAQR